MYAKVSLSFILHMGTNIYRMHLHYVDVCNISLHYVYKFSSTYKHLDYDLFHYISYSLTSESMGCNIQYNIKSQIELWI
jgi:hypothetical protein